MQAAEPHPLRANAAAGVRAFAGVSLFPFAMLFVAGVRDQFVGPRYRSTIDDGDFLPIVVGLVLGGLFFLAVRPIRAGRQVVTLLAFAAMCLLVALLGLMLVACAVGLRKMLTYYNQQAPNAIVKVALAGAGMIPLSVAAMLCAAQLLRAAAIGGKEVRGFDVNTVRPVLPIDTPPDGDA